MRKVVFVFLFLIFASLTIFLGFTTDRNYQPNTYYRVYLDWELLGTINSEDVLIEQMNKQQAAIIKKYQTNEVFNPQGLEIKKIVSYEEKTITEENMYNLIQNKKPFTIEGKQVTIYSETDEQKIKDFENKLFEECSFITGENVNFSNLYRFIPIIKSIIVEQYPFITKLNYLDTSTLDFMTINTIIRCYRTDYGDKLLVKSLKKGMVKSLKIQDK